MTQISISINGICLNFNLNLILHLNMVLVKKFKSEIVRLQKTLNNVRFVMMAIFCYLKEIASVFL